MDSVAEPTARTQALVVVCPGCGCPMELKRSWGFGKFWSCKILSCRKTLSRDQAKQQQEKRLAKAPFGEPKIVEKVVNGQTVNVEVYPSHRQRKVTSLKQPGRPATPG